MKGSSKETEPKILIPNQIILSVLPDGNHEIEAVPHLGVWNLVSKHCRVKETIVLPENRFRF